MVFAFFAASILGALLGYLLHTFLLRKTNFQKPRDFRHLDAQCDATSADGPPPAKIKDKHIRNDLKQSPWWVVWPEYDRVLWLNTATEVLWSSICAATDKTVRLVVETEQESWCETARACGVPLQSIKLEQLEFGESPIRFSGIKIYKTQHDEIIMDLPVQWGSQMCARASAHLRLGPIQIYIPVEIRNPLISALCRVIFKPLCQELPVIGAVTATLVDQPKLALDLFLGDSNDLILRPFVGLLMDYILDVSIGDMMVYPNAMTFDVMPKGGMTPPMDGMLSVKVLSASGLPSTWNDIIDPYITLTVRKGRRLKTKTKNNDPDPTFNETFKFIVDDIESQSLTIMVKDEDIIVNSVVGYQLMSLSSCLAVLHPNKRIVYELGILSIPKQGVAAACTKKDEPNKGIQEDAVEPDIDDLDADAVIKRSHKTKKVLSRKQLGVDLNSATVQYYQSSLSTHGSISLEHAINCVSRLRSEHSILMGAMGTNGSAANGQAGTGDGASSSRNAVLSANGNPGCPTASSKPSNRQSPDGKDNIAGDQQSVLGPAENLLNKQDPGAEKFKTGMGKVKKGVKTGAGAMKNATTAMAKKVQLTLLRGVEAPDPKEKPVFASVSVPGEPKMGTLRIELEYRAFTKAVTAEYDPNDWINRAQPYESATRVDKHTRGVITVTLVQCKSLGDNVHSFVTLTLYAPGEDLGDSSQLVNSGSVTSTTKINAANPRWDEEFDFVDVPALSSIKAEVFNVNADIFGVSGVPVLGTVLNTTSAVVNKVTGHKRVRLGWVSIPLQEVVKNGVLKDVWTLREAQKGYIEMRLDWREIPNDPAFDDDLL